MVAAGISRRVSAGAALLAVLALVAPGARGQQQGGAELTFESISAWTSTDAPLQIALSVANRGDAPLAGVSVRVTVYGRVFSRSQLRAALEGRPSGSEIATTSEELDAPIAASDRRRIRIERDLAPLGSSFRSGRARSGVYPLRIALDDGERTLAQAYSAMVFLASEPLTRINVAPVFTVHQPAAFGRDGSYDPELLDRGVLSASFAETASFLADGAGRGTLAITGSLLESLAEMAGGFTLQGQTEAVAPGTGRAAQAATVLERLRDAGEWELASTTYGRADVGALEASGLSADAARQVNEGRLAAGEILGRDPSISLFVPADFRADRDASATLATLGVRRMVLDPAILPPPPDSLFGPSAPAAISGAAGVEFDALLADPDIRERLGRAGEDPVLVAQGVIAESASSFFELPGLAAERLLVIASDPIPSAGVLRPLFGALSRAPWVRLVRAGEAFEATPPPAGEPATPLPALGASVRAALDDGRGARGAIQITRSARALLGRLARVLVDPAPKAGLIDRLLFAAESADGLKDPLRTARLAAGARSEAAAILRAISVPKRQVTLTSREGDVPVTIINETGLRVRIRLALESSRIGFPAGRTRTFLLDGRIRTIAFPVVARATGSFPVTVRLFTPDGRDEIGSGTLVVRSTAVSAVTLVAIGGALAILVVATVASRRRRARAGAARAG